MQFLGRVITQKVIALRFVGNEAVGGGGRSPRTSAVPSAHSTPFGAFASEVLVFLLAQLCLSLGQRCMR